jgi:hypothetical protein
VVNTTTHHSYPPQLLSTHHSPLTNPAQLATLARFSATLPPGDDGEKSRGLDNLRHSSKDRVPK